MRIQTFIALFAILCSGVSFSIAQPSSSPAPFFVSITNINRERVHVSSHSRADGTAFLLFFFERNDKTEIDELLTDGVRNKRQVRIIDGQRLIAEGRVAGRGRSETAQGLVLAFDSTAAAERAATAIRQSGAKEDFDTFVRRNLDDRRNWRL